LFKGERKVLLPKIGDATVTIMCHIYGAVENYHDAGGGNDDGHNPFG